MFHIQKPKVYKHAKLSAEKNRKNTYVKRLYISYKHIRKQYDVKIYRVIRRL